MRVGRNAVYLDTQFLEFSVMIGQVFEFGRAYEGEIGGIENEDRPFAGHRRVAYVDELAVMEGGRRARLDFGVDQRHQNSLLELKSTSLKYSHYSASRMPYSG